MGGSGSGNWYRYSKKDTTKDYCDLDVNYLVKHGYIAEHKTSNGSLTWSRTRGAEKYIRSSISFRANTLAGHTPYLQVMYTNTTSKEKFDYPISLTATTPNYGGKRWWFLCPIVGCGKRVGMLYLGNKYFACRRCYNLAYESQNESPEFRFLTKAQEIHERLGGSGCTDDWVEKPKGMHQKTFDRLIREMRDYHSQSMQAMATRFRLFEGV